MENLSEKITKQQLMNDFKTVMSDAEALLLATVDQGGEKLSAVRAKAEESMRIAKNRMTEAQNVLFDHTQSTASATNTYVRANPWKTLGLIASVSMVVGLLISRR